MMKRYEKYKPSGVEWIGEIPARWEVKRLKFNTYIKARVGWHGLRADEFSLTDGVLCITGTDLQNGKVNWENCYRVSEDRYNEDPYIQVKEKDLLITKDGTIGKVAVVQNLMEKATLNSGVFVVRPEREQYSTPYMYWAFQSPVFSEYVYYASKGSTINHLYQETFFNLPFILPQPTEQTAIAAYLDEKTARIDKLIANKQRLIDLLKEERTAIINHAVTKGVNPKAKLKPSGTEWLGDIPDQWEVKRLKYLTKTISKGTTPSTIGAEIIEKGLVRFLKAENILQSNIISEEPQNYIDEQTNNLLKRSELRENDILIVIAGATIGKTAILKNEFIPANTNQAVCFIRLLEQSHSTWVWLYFQARYIKETISLEAVQSAQPNLSMEKIGNFIICVPPLDERIKIEKHIETATQKIDATISKIEKEIELMQEYRTALISEVVTGKIKVI